MDSLESYKQDKSNEEQRHQVALRMLESRLHELQIKCKHPPDRVSHLGWDHDILLCGLCDKLL